MGAHQENSILVGFIFRKDGIWHLFNSGTPGPGKVFTECEDLIKNNLKHVGMQEYMLMESKKWSASSGKKFKMKKDDVICIPKGLNEL